MMTVLLDQMSEDFVFDVDFNTSFERIEALRSKMLMFVKSERRDYMPSFDIEVVGAGYIFTPSTVCDRC